MFKKGDYVVKPNTGVCIIEDIIEMSLGDEEREYYVLQPVGDVRSKLYVSIDADRKRLRIAMDKAAAKAFIEQVSRIEAAEIENDKAREQSYKDAFLSNEPEELISILKNMYTRGQERIARGKKITATDERYFRQAEMILFTELGTALGIDMEKVRDIISERIQNA